jgi:hypothetical protein
MSQCVRRWAAVCVCVSVCVHMVCICVCVRAAERLPFYSPLPACNAAHTSATPAAMYGALS